jgi:hypothetical protein
LIVVETIALALPIEVGLRCLSLDALVSRLGRLGQESSEQGPALDVERIARLVDATTAFHPLNQTCLKKSLILLRILRRRGIRAELHLGVRKVDEQFSAHAWVAYEGRIVLGGDIADLFTPLPLMGLARAPHVRRT